VKTLLRYFLINLAALSLTAHYIPGLTFTGGFKSLFLGAIAFMLINFLLVPLLKVLFLPLNLLTLGLFSFLINVLALYALTTIVSDFVLVPFHFSGLSLGVISIPGMDLATFWVAVLASIMIGVITHFLQWLVH
jgi:putative membrane protein